MDSSFEASKHVYSVMGSCDIEQNQQSFLSPEDNDYEQGSGNVSAQGDAIRQDDANMPVDSPTQEQEVATQERQRRSNRELDLMDYEEWESSNDVSIEPTNAYDHIDIDRLNERLLLRVTSFEPDDGSDYQQTEDTHAISDSADKVTTPLSDGVIASQTPTTATTVVLQSSNRDRSTTIASVSASPPETRVRSVTRSEKESSPRALHHRWDVDDDSLPRVFEIFGGHYSTFRMDLRKLFVRCQGLSQCLDRGECFTESINGFKLPDWHSRSRGMEGVNYLQSRDLRRLDFNYTPGEEPTVLIRRHAVLISVPPWRAIVMADRIIGFVPDGADGLLKSLYIQMGVWDGMTTTASLPRISNSKNSFESRAYEAVFGTAIEIRKQEEESIRGKIDTITRIMKKYSIVPFEVQEKMRQYKNRVSEMLEKVGACRHILDELLESDESMSLMNLSLLKDRPELYRPPLSADLIDSHEDMEALLDSYLMDCNALNSRLKLSLSKLQNAEDMVSLRLDTSRNQLLITSTTLSVLSCSLALGGFVGSIFGMNLMNTIVFETKDLFWIVSGLTIFSMVVLTFAAIAYMKYYEIIPARGMRFSRSELRKL